MTICLETTMPNRIIEWTATAEDIRARFSSVGALMDGAATHWLTIERLDKKGGYWVVLNRVAVKLDVE